MRADDRGISTDHSIYALASDGGDHVYYTDGFAAYRLSSALGELNSWSGYICVPYGIAANPEAVFISEGAGGSPCVGNKIQKFDTGGHWTVNPSTCQRKGMVLAGFMYVSAYAPAVVAVTGLPTADPENPSHDLAKVTDCQGAEIVVDPSRLAWVSFGGAAVGGNDAGCNPLYGPCEQALVPVLPTTWGRIKSKYTPIHD